MKFPDIHPVVLGTVTTAAGLRSLARKTIPADAIEVRVDALLSAKVPLEKIEAALQARKHPVLLTLRIPAEGGHMTWIVKERRATFAATPEQDRRRPSAQTRWDDLFLAGDWTKTGLPATIEGALRSGRTAAAACALEAYRVAR